MGAAMKRGNTRRTWDEMPAGIPMPEGVADNG